MNTIIFDYLSDDKWKPRYLSRIIFLIHSSKERYFMLIAKRVRMTREMAVIYVDH